MSHRGDRYGKKYIQCNFIYRLSLQPWVSRCARGTVPWVHRDTHDWRLSPLYLQLFLLCMVLVWTPRRIPPSTIPKEFSKHYLSTFNDRVNYKIGKNSISTIELEVLQTHIWNKRSLVFLSFIQVISHQKYLESNKVILQASEILLKILWGFISI